MSRAERTDRGPHRGPTLLALALVGAGSATVQRWAGFGGLGIYALLALVVVRRWPRWDRAVTSRLSPSEARVAALVVLASLALAWAALYPEIDVDLPGRGSDADDALDVAVRELLGGRYPYRARTYLDNPLSPMPGAVLLAAPFALLGASAAQNLVWLGAWLGLLRAGLDDVRRAVLAWVVVLLLCPTAVYQLLVGSDGLTNGVYVLAGALAAVRWPLPASGWRGWAAAAFFGVALSSRAHFLVVAPLVAGLLHRRAGARTALATTGGALAVFAAVTLPFYLWEPDAFSPLHTASRLTAWDAVVPFASSVVLVATGGLSIALARRVDDEASLARAAALCLVLPIAWAVVGSSLAAGEVTLRFASYWVGALPFAVQGLAAAGPRSPSGAC